MALIRATSGSGGGGITIDDLKFDGKTQIHTITTSGASWTATQDCIMCAKISGSSGTAPEVKFDGQNILMAYYSGNAQAAYIGWNESSMTTKGIGAFVPKGTVVTTRSGVGTYDLQFYA